jgi:hypothetical protein
MSETTTTSTLHGLAAEYADDQALLAAAHAARAAGYTLMDGYSPIPVHGLHEALGGKRTILPYITLAGALAGLLGGIGLQVWVSAIEYPLNFGGRPYLSWPSFFPIAFECMILGAGLATVGGLFGLCRFPEPYHPIFNAPNFAAATRDRFFLCIEATDPKFDPAAVRVFLEGTQALNVAEVES